MTSRALQVGISLAKILLHAIRPGIEVLGIVPGTNIYCEASQYPMASKPHGVLVIRIESGLLCFANANFIRHRLISHIPCIFLRIHNTLLLNFVSIMSSYLCCFCLGFRIMRLVEEEEDSSEETVKASVKVVVLDMSSKYIYIYII